METDTSSEEQCLIYPEGEVHDDSGQINSVTNENYQDGTNNANVENTGVVGRYHLKWCDELLIYPPPLSPPVTFTFVILFFLKTSHTPP